MAYIGSGLTRFNTADDLTVTDDAEIGGNLTVTGSADINGGTIDGVTIGGASAGAGTFTGLTVDGDGTLQTSDGAVLTLKSTDTTLASTEVVGSIQFNTADSSDAGVASKIEANAENASGEVGLNFHTGKASALTKRMNVSRDGDISFYEDTGTTPKLFWDASAESLGIGTTSPYGKMHLFSASAGTVTAANGGDELVLENSGTVGMTFLCPNNSAANILFGDPDDNNVGSIQYGHDTNYMAFATNASERMRIDSSGNLLVGTTSFPSGSNTGFYVNSGGYVYASQSGATAAYFNRTTSDGSIAEFRKNGTTVGSIGTQNGSDFYITGTPSDDTGLRFQTNEIVAVNDAGNNRDNAIDLGNSNVRFDDIYATNGTIQTSDRNEKQDIEELTEAEQRVAVAAKSLMRKFRWKDKVAEKGDDARIHFGIIAQDLQAAFEAEGLDAGRYGMFMYNEWWETYTDVPAVEAQDAVYETVVIPAVTEDRLVSEAVLDEEGNEIEAAVYETVVVQEETTEERLVSEAVEAKEAYTRTDTYDTEEEAPEGAVKKSRMGVRYSELLAFIIAAI